jgi:hypothetical protein
VVNKNGRRPSRESEDNAAPVASEAAGSAKSATTLIAGVDFPIKISQVGQSFRGPPISAATEAAQRKLWATNEAKATQRWNLDTVCRFEFRTLLKRRGYDE